MSRTVNETRVDSKRNVWMNILDPRVRNPLLMVVKVSLTGIATQALERKLKDWRRLCILPTHSLLLQLLQLIIIAPSLKVLVIVVVVVVKLCVEFEG